ncbi:LLM class flavin-dependent oxidoreductase [Lelliottia jeotgali]
MNALEPALSDPPATTPNDDLRRGAIAAVPVLLGFIPFALVLGAQASQRSLAAGEVALMTGLNFGGGSEFAAIELWTSPPAILVIVAMTLLVNSRHLLMGATLAPYLRNVPLRQALGALFFMCDESWAMGLADARRRGGFSLRYYMGVSLCLWGTWVCFTTLGALVGPLLGDLHSYGFDMAFAAVFLVLLKGMWYVERGASRPALVLQPDYCGTLLSVDPWWLVRVGWHCCRPGQRLPMGQTLSGGRLILGLSSGDRAVEYPAFGIDYETRAERYQEGVQLINTVTQNSFPSASSTHFGNLTGAIDLIPKPMGKRIPTLVVGRARQDFSWIAENTDGWMWHLSDFRRLPQLIADWRASWPDATFRPYSYGAFYDIVEDPDAPLQQIGNGVRMGRNALIALWKRQQAEGVSHIALNLKPIRRPAEDVLTELAEHVLPHFRID